LRSLVRNDGAFLRLKKSDQYKAAIQWVALGLKESRLVIPIALINWSI
jgi:hypothetical protein